MSDFEKQPWFIPVIATAAVAVAGITALGASKYYNNKKNGSSRTNSTSSDDSKFSEAQYHPPLPYGTRTAQGIKKSKKHNRKTKKRR
jgi:hypothetical protein